MAAISHHHHRPHRRLLRLAHFHFSRDNSLMTWEEEGGGGDVIHIPEKAAGGGRGKRGGGGVEDSHLRFIDFGRSMAVAHWFEMKSSADWTGGGRREGSGGHGHVTAATVTIRFINWRLLISCVRIREVHPVAPSLGEFQNFSHFFFNPFFFPLSTWRHSGSGSNSISSNPDNNFKF